MNATDFPLCRCTIFHARKHRLTSLNLNIVTAFPIFISLAVTRARRRDDTGRFPVCPVSDGRTKEKTVERSTRKKESRAKLRRCPYFPRVFLRPHVTTIVTNTPLVVAQPQILDLSSHSLEPIPRDKWHPLRNANNRDISGLQVNHELIIISFVLSFVKICIQYMHSAFYFHAETKTLSLLLLL